MVGSPAATRSKPTNTTPSQSQAPLPRSGFVHEAHCCHPPQEHKPARGSEKQGAKYPSTSAVRHCSVAPGCGEKVNANHFIRLDFYAKGSNCFDLTGDSPREPPDFSPASSAGLCQYMRRMVRRSELTENQSGQHQSYFS